MKPKTSISKISIIIIILITVIAASNLRWGADNWKALIASDAKGYYVYLPAILIYNDLNLDFFDAIEKEKYYDKNYFTDYRAIVNGRIITKFYCGTALAELPFFLIGHFASYLFNYDMDGYSKLYPILINIGALFYLLIGLLYLNSSLKMYHIKEWQISLTLFAAVFGTNLFYYAVIEPGMSHIYSFAFISMFFYYSKRYYSSFQKKYILILAIILGIIVLIRPVNGLIILIWPFAAANLDFLKRGLFAAIRNKVMLIYGFFIFLGIISIQLIIYKVSTGNFFAYPYSQEGFNFLSPHMIDILFSYKKGLFLYTPIYFLSLTGFWFLWNSSRFEFYSLLGFFIVITYVFSSWWMWYYGGSFSSRVYVDYISLFMILLGISLNRIKQKSIVRSYISLIVILIVICQIQTYQYRYSQIHWSDMTKEKYWDVFLRVDKLIEN
jgi:hypothetical protein